MKGSSFIPFLSGVFLASIGQIDASAVVKRALQAPQTLDNGYQLQGCYVDVGRTINGANTADAQMTNAKCAAFCFSKGFPYAGSEYTSECYCGSSLATGGVKAPDNDCQMACGGDATQPCGGPGRLTLYKTDQITGPSVNPGVGGWVSIGCYSEGKTGRTLTYGVGTVPNAQMTVAKCTAACKAADATFILAGVEYGGECYCGKKISNGGAPASIDKCNMPCNGNSSEYCGAGGYLNVYDFEMQYPTR